MNTPNELGRGDLAAEIERAQCAAIEAGRPDEAMGFGNGFRAGYAAALRPQPGPGAEEVAKAIRSAVFRRWAPPAAVERTIDAFAIPSATAAIQALYAPHLSSLSGDRERALAGDIIPPGYELVPVAALKWLHGLGPDDNGHHFGEGPEAENARGRFWWRSVFRRMCSRSLTTETRGGDDAA
ncbi:hypothetical protein [Enterovirga aerilata]|uniref:Uncharacterized protein n=1 Tax=Enterovirga aerilata TaxID=2730920 RepID=A0A849IEY4_9HYPH|nr:hypothetical protein [Enterovirga sp. DB1703]NNM75009.1 hypothetical protein [Enterovirga sp. DB1703]